jgi:hypothetical protein
MAPLLSKVGTVITKRRVIDISERVLLAFVGAFIAIYLAAFAKGDSDLAFLRDPGLFSKAGEAGIAAVVPLISGLVGFKVGDKQTASVVPSNAPEEPELPPMLYVYNDNPTEGDH